MAPLVSVLVNNFNYGRFLGASIDSALAQDYRPLEVVVVDDGSTDNSREVIAGYGNRVRAVLKENGGQASAINAGFAATSGEIVLILDADDYLYPNAVSAVVAAWEDGCAKAQFRLTLIDEAGTRTGVMPPAEVAMPSGDLVPVIAAYGPRYVGASSNNAYARPVLEELLPVPPDFATASDAYLNALAPFYGKVVSIDAELGTYRRHGSNIWSGRVGLEQLRAFLAHDATRERFVYATARRLGRQMPSGLALRDPVHVLHRLCHLRLDPKGHPVREDTRRRLLAAGAAAIRRSPELAGAERLYHLGLIAAIAAVPRPLAPRLVRWAMTSKPRPAWMRLGRRALRSVGVRRRTLSPASAAAAEK